MDEPERLQASHLEGSRGLHLDVAEQPPDSRPASQQPSRQLRDGGRVKACNASPSMRIKRGGAAVANRLRKEGVATEPGRTDGKDLRCESTSPANDSHAPGVVVLRRARWRYRDPRLCARMRSTRGP